MSVGVIKVTNDKIVIGADSIIVYGTSQKKESQAKIKSPTNEITFVSSGYLREIALFNIFCKSHKPSRNDCESMIDFFNDFSLWLKNKIDDSELTNAYLIVFNKKAYHFYDYDVEEIKDCYCIGAGHTFADASMYHNKTVKEAIECACELSIYCEKPVNIIEIKK